jgi:hypothetical protein
MNTEEKWNLALKACVDQFDTDTTLRKRWDDEDKAYLSMHAGFSKKPHWSERYSKEMNDPVERMRPPDSALDRIRDALKRLEKASANAAELKNAELENAEKQDSQAEKQNVRDEINNRYSKATAEQVKAVEGIEDALAKAGVYALSLRIPAIVNIDIERESRCADPATKKLFEAASCYTCAYPSRTRRLLHVTKSVKKRAQIQAKSRAECLAKIEHDVEVAEKESAERQAQRNERALIEQSINQMGGICTICKWAHQSDMTFWLNPFTGEKQQVRGNTQKQTFLMKLHKKMEGANGSDVSISELCGKRNGGGPKDILGNHYLILFFHTGDGRGRIRAPEEKRAIGRPRKAPKECVVNP